MHQAVAKAARFNPVGISPSFAARSALECSFVIDVHLWKGLDDVSVQGVSMSQSLEHRISAGQAPFAAGRYIARPGLLDN